MGIAKKNNSTPPHFSSLPHFARKSSCHGTLTGVASPGGLPYERGGDARRFVTGVNFGFWSHLGCSGQNAKIFSRKGLLGL